MTVSTAGANMDVNTGTDEEIMSEHSSVKKIYQTGDNAWEVEALRKAVKATRRKCIVIVGLSTEVRLTFPRLDMPAEVYEICPPVVAVGDVSRVAHDHALIR